MTSPAEGPCCGYSSGVRFLAIVKQEAKQCPLLSIVQKGEGTEENLSARSLNKTKFSHHEFVKDAHLISSEISLQISFDVKFASLPSRGVD